MNEQNDIKWQNLLAMSAPTFVGTAEPPYGFTTRVLAQIRAENQQVEVIERVGIRFFFASLAILLLTFGVNQGVKHAVHAGDPDPGLRNVVQVENVQIS